MGDHMPRTLALGRNQLSTRLAGASVPFARRAYRAIASLSCAFACAMAPALALAQEVGNTIVLGHSAPFSGVLAASNKEAVDGAKAYFELVNRRGGVHGRKIELVTMDDKQDVKTSLDNTRKLIDEKRAFALFMYRTSPVLEATLPVVEKERVPFLFPQVGPSFVYDPKLRQVFTLRATYQAEAKLAVEQAVRLGLKRIAILVADDAFGRDAIKGAEAAMTAANLQPVGVEKYDNKTGSVDKTIDEFAKLQPQAVLLIGNAKANAALVKGTKAKGLNAQFIALSNSSSQAFVDDMGEAGRGVGIMQVMPNPIRGSGVAADFMKMRESFPDVKASHAAFQGYLSARVFVDAAQRAGKALTRERLTSALENMNVDYGGYRIQYSPTNRNGSDFIELSIVGKGGKILL
jgi:branched-chain amino acid transport system substrate-binding protein